LAKLEDFQIRIPIDPSVEAVVQCTRRVPFYLQEPLLRWRVELLGNMSYRTGFLTYSLAVPYSSSSQETQILVTGVGHENCQFSNTQKALPNVNNRSDAVGSQWQHRV
jgi:hypothetical protein